MLSYKMMIASPTLIEGEKAEFEFMDLFSRAHEATRIKSHLLAEGVAIDETAIFEDSKPLVVGLYLHSDQRPSSEFPQEIIIDDLQDILPAADGPFISNVRVNPHSPWRLVKHGGELALTNNGHAHPVTLPEKPTWYDRELSNRVKTSNVAQKLGTDGIGVVPNNACSYFGSGAECRFCEIVPSYARALTYRTAKKPIKQVVEAITLAATEDPAMRYLFLTTGNDPTYDETYSRYIDLLRRIHPVMKERGITTFGVLMPPDDFSLIEQIHEAGLDTVTFNLEVWDSRLFNIMTPGKASYGRDRMLAALDRAVDVFGKGNVLTNLIYGIQSYEFGNHLWRFDPKREEEILLEGIEELIRRGILPTHTIYHTAGVNTIGPIQLDADPMLSYHLQYARRARKSGIIPPDRFGLFGGLGTVSNSLFNDAYVTVALQEKV